VTQWLLQKYNIHLDMFRLAGVAAKTWCTFRHILQIVSTFDGIRVLNGPPFFKFQNFKPFIYYHKY